jgi:hypothetical protein
MSEKTSPPVPNLSTKEFRALKSLKLNKDTRVLRADKYNFTVVLDEPVYKYKLNILRKSGVYESISKDPTDGIVSKLQKFLSKAWKTSAERSYMQVNTILQQISTYVWSPQSFPFETCSEFYRLPTLLRLGWCSSQVTESSRREV